MEEIQQKEGYWHCEKGYWQEEKSSQEEQEEMKKCACLQDAIQAIKHRHSSLNRQKQGVNCWKMLRLPNGDRIPFEEMRGVRFTDFSVYDHNTLIIEQQSHGVVPHTVHSNNPKVTHPVVVPFEPYSEAVEVMPNKVSPSSFASSKYKKQTFSAKIYLSGLSLINVYDHSAEFRTSSGIELFYCENNFASNIILLSSWINNTSDILRAQWYDDCELERLLDSCGPDQRMERAVSFPRGIDFGMSL